MKLYKAILLIQILFSFRYYAQKETHVAVQVHYLTDTSSVNILPTVIANNQDTLQLDKRYNNYLAFEKTFVFICDGEYNPERKVSLKIQHPHYPELNLDSVNLTTDISLKLLNPNEHFYVNNGIKTSLNHQRNYISIMFEVNSNVDSILSILSNKYKLEVAVNFRDSIEANSEDRNIKGSKHNYGGIEDHLSYTFWMKKEDGTIFLNNDSMYNDIRNIHGVSFLGVPQSFWQNLTNGFIIHLKKGIDSEEINTLITKYSLAKDASYDTYLKYHSEEHHFTTNDLLPDNQVMIELMKENIVKFVVIKEMSYETH